MPLPIQRGAISSLAPLSYLTPAIIFGFMYSFSAKLIAWAICGGVGIFWAQTPRCFLFGMRGLPENADWRDTAFVACASNPGLIQEVLDELTKPLSDRRHINGPIAAGDGGHNFNGPHRFAWHFVPDQWSLAEISIELCDGRPYSDVEQNLQYWLYQVGRFCPWSSAPLREVSVSNALAAIPPKFSLNPTGDHLRVEAPIVLDGAVLTLYNSLGLPILTIPLSGPSREIPLPPLPNGLYLIQLRLASTSVLRPLWLLR